jgi:hypothetical protein
MARQAILSPSAGGEAGQIRRYSNPQPTNNTALGESDHICLVTAGKKVCSVSENSEKKAMNFLPFSAQNA